MDIDRRSVRARFRAFSAPEKTLAIIGGVLFSPLWIAAMAIFFLRNCAFQFLDLFSD